MRVNVSIPDELHRSIRERCPELNVSAIVQEALRALVGCDHRRGTVCSTCAAPINLGELTDRARHDAWRIVWHLLGDAVRQGWTVEGVARVARSRAIAQAVPGAEHWSLPRPTTKRRAELADRGPVEPPDELYASA